MKGLGGALKLAKAPKLAKIGTTAAKVSDALNPATAILSAAKSVLNLASDAAISATVRPSAAIRKDFGGHRGVADAIRRERVYSDASATKKLEASRQEADALLAAKEAEGVAGVDSSKLVEALEGEPRARAALRSELGVEDNGSTEDLIDRIRNVHTEPGTPGTTPTVIDIEPAPDAVDAAIRATNELGVTQASQIPSALFGNVDPAAVRAARELGPQANLVPRRLLGTSQEAPRQIVLGGDTPATPPRMREIPLTHAQELKREAQDLAYELGKDNETIRSLQQEAVARALREGIEERVPEVAPINERTQRLLGAQRAFEAAEDRPDALGLKLAVPTLGTSVLFDSPRAGAVLGIALGDAARFAGNPQAGRAAILARLAGNAQFMKLPLNERAAIIAEAFRVLDEQGAAK